MKQKDRDEPEAEEELAPEPVPESEHEPSDSCLDDHGVDIEPLSGKPYFHFEITGSHIGDIGYKYQLILPAQFARTLPSKAVPVTLARGGRTWEMTYLGNNSQYCRRFDIKWKAFAKDNKLKAGDVCVFELMECSETELKFKVQVLRGDFPPVLVANQDGSIDKPIVID